MKAKVVLPFFDKEFGKNRKKGDVLEINASRFHEILRKGAYVEAVDGTAAKREKIIKNSEVFEQ